MQSDVAREIMELWSAGTPIIYIVTTEEDRAIAIVRDAAARANEECGVWSLHRGLLPFAPKAHHPLEVLEALATPAAPAMAALLDFHQPLAEARVARRL